MHQTLHMKGSPHARRVTFVAGFLAIVFLLAFALRNTPVLIHVFGETDCACGDYHGRVTGLIVLNPFRDRLPEERAAQFLEETRKGRCTVEASLCKYALNGHRVSDWRLANREDRGGRVLLYYRLAKSVFPEPIYHGLTGEGVVEVKRTQNEWTVVSYSSYF
jgi:hypothetical protein